MEEMETAYILLIVSEVLGAAVLRTMMRRFFDAPSQVQPGEYIGYALYGIFRFLCYVWKIHVAAGLIGQLILLTAVTFSYSSKLKVKFCTVLYIFSAVLLSDMTFLILCSCRMYSALVLNRNLCVWSCFISKLMMVALLRLFTLGKEKKYSFLRVPLRYLLLAASVPVISLYLLYILATGIASPLRAAGCGVCILAVNIVVMALYFRTAAYYEERMEKQVFADRALMNMRNLATVLSSVQKLRIFRHDMINHFMVLEHNLKRKKYEDALTYLRKMNSLCTDQNGFRTGNVAVDGILGGKIPNARKRGVQIFSDIRICEEPPFSDFDLTCILGNLLDNAVEAAEKTSHGEIHIQLECVGQGFSLMIRNTFEGKLCTQNDLLMTTKTDCELHGIGLQSVAQTVRKYRGILEIYREGRYFCTVIKLNEN